MAIDSRWARATHNVCFGPRDQSGKKRGLDLGKIREDAAWKLTTDHYRKVPESTVIHFHNHDQQCEGFEHEEFFPGG